MTSPDSKYHELQKQIGYQFKDKSLLDLALSHASARSAHNGHNAHNERMEFFGDRVLGLIIAEHLLRQEDLPVGKMAQYLAYLASRPVCAEITRKLSLLEYAQLASNIRKDSLNKDSLKKDSLSHLAVYANMCEALLAAIYLDGGLKAARDFVEKFWEFNLNDLDDDLYQSSKNVLQEASQALGGAVPAYEVISHSGPDHAPTFVVEVRVPSFGNARGEGSSRRLAEKNAAQNLLAALRQNESNER